MLSTFRQHFRRGPAAGGDRIDKLEQLTKLRDAGALDAEEFEREKKRVLADEA